MIIPIADELNRIAKGEILSDDWSKEIYSVDASHYSIKPSVIVCPFDEHDLSQICQYGYSKNTSITARDAGTGLLGQSLNDNMRNLHTRPMVDIESQSELEVFDIVANEVFTKVISCGGTITGEHGDGIARTKYIEFMYGLQIVSIFEQIKKLFDPKFIMNPGKKVIRDDV